MSTKAISISLLVSIVIIIIIYSVLMFVFFNNKIFIFEPYHTPKPPEPSFHPLGEVRPMTQEEIDRRNRIIKGEDVDTLTVHRKYFMRT